MAGWEWKKDISDYLVGEELLVNQKKSQNRKIGPSLGRTREASSSCKGNETARAGKFNMHISYGNGKKVIPKTFPSSLRGSQQRNPKEKH